MFWKENPYVRPPLDRAGRRQYSPPPWGAEGKGAYKMEKLLVLGAGGFGHVVAEVAADLGYDALSLTVNRPGELEAEAVLLLAAALPLPPWRFLILRDVPLPKMLKLLIL